jgi:hypothetical protein
MTSKNTRHSLFILSALFFLATTVAAQKGEPTFNQGEIIDSVTTLFRARYLYPETAVRMDSLLRTNLAAGKYQKDTTFESFLLSLREDLFAVSHDLHIAIDPIPENRWYVVEGETATAEQIAALRADNFGWKELKYLPGGVGYINVVSLEDATFAGPTAEAALSFMANCRALVIDLRQNHGGEENMNILMCSYFCEQPTQLSSLYWTYLDSTAPSWTQTELKGTHLYDKELYLLTSRATASGAEAFAYNLKNYQRATLVGETTVGAAHWSDWHEFPNLGVVVLVPVARPIHPKTGTSWEGTGVTPDITVPADQALDRAYIDALEKLAAKETDEAKKREIEWLFPVVQARLNPVKLTEETISKYVGEYRHPTLERRYGIVERDGKLYFRYSDSEECGISPLTETVFAFDDDNPARVEMVLNGSGAVVEFRILTPDGEVRSRPRVSGTN